MKAFYFGGLAILTFIALLITLGHLHTTPIQRDAPAPRPPTALTDPTRSLQQDLAACQSDLQHIQLNLNQPLAEESAHPHPPAHRQEEERSSDRMGPSAASWPRRKGRQYVILAAFPSSGADYLRTLLSAVSKAPTFSVYKEPSIEWIDQTGIDTARIPVYSSCLGSEICAMPHDFPILLKTHFPAVMMQSNLPAYQRVVHLIRNPVDNLESFFRMCQTVPWLASRKRDWFYHLKKEIAEYKKFHDFWHRFETDSKVNTLTMRYEDLCEAPADMLRHVLDFLDYSHEVTDAMIDQAVKDNPCPSEEHIGSSLSQYTVDQLELVQTELASLMRPFDYEYLLDSFNGFVAKEE